MELIEPKEINFTKPLIIYNVHSPERFEKAKTIIEFLIDRYGKKINTIYIEKEFISDIKKNLDTDDKEKIEEYEKYFKVFDLENDKPDICITVGGDGTVLFANNLFKDKKRPPFVGFLGDSMDFLSLHSFDKYKEVLTGIFEKKNCYTILKHSLIECKIKKVNLLPKKLKQSTINVGQGETHDFKEYDELVDTIYALNEISIERDSKILNMSVYINGNKFTTISADGLLFSTMTGSTAYSLSAGGPILHYDVDGLIFNSICPFTMSMRPIVFPKGEKLYVRNTGLNRGSPRLLYDSFLSLNEIKNEYLLEISLSDKIVEFYYFGDKSSLETDWINKISNYLGFNREIIKHK